MKTLACGEGSHEEVNNGTAVPLKKSPFRAFSSHPFHGWLLTFNPPDFSQDAGMNRME
jgi:hypothetical protein